MGTATIPRGGGTAAPAKGLPNQPGNPNEIKPFKRPSSPPPAQSPPATPPASNEIKPFQRSSAPPAAAPQNEIKPFQRAPGLPSPQPASPSPIKGSPGGSARSGRVPGPTPAKQRLERYLRDQDMRRAGIKPPSEMLDDAANDALKPLLGPARDAIEDGLNRFGPAARNQLERAKEFAERAKEAAKNAWDKLWNPAGNKQIKRGYPDPDADNQPVPPVGNPGDYVRVVYGYRTWDGVTGTGARGGVAPFRGLFWTVSSTGQKVGHMQFEGHTEVFAIQQVPDLVEPTKYDSKFWIISVTPWQGGEPYPPPEVELGPLDDPVFNPDLLPNGLPAPRPVPSPKSPPKPFPRSPQPSPPPTPKRAPRKAPAPTPSPNPNPSPDTPPSPAQGSPGYPSPGPAPAWPSTSTSTRPNISPKDGREKAPNQDPNEAPDPPQEPEMNCKDPCIGSIQEAQQEAKKDRDKKKPVKITVDVFKDCDGENGAARFDKKEISVPADEADHLKLLYQQLASANALECRLDLSVAVPEEQIRRRPKFLPEMVLFFETVRKQSNGKRSNYSMTVFHWDKPKGVKPSIPNHTKGNHIKIVTLTDGCRLSTSGKTKQEANKIMVAVLRNVPKQPEEGKRFYYKIHNLF